MKHLKAWAKYKKGKTVKEMPEDIVAKLEKEHGQLRPVERMNLRLKIEKEIGVNPYVNR